jgi:hypothetical protein
MCLRVRSTRKHIKLGDSLLVAETLQIAYNSTYGLFKSTPG